MIAYPSSDKEFAIFIMDLSGVPKVYAVETKEKLRGITYADDHALPKIDTQSWECPISKELLIRIHSAWVDGIGRTSLGPQEDILKYWEAFQKEYTGDFYHFCHYSNMASVAGEPKEGVGFAMAELGKALRIYAVTGDEASLRKKLEALEEEIKKHPIPGETASDDRATTGHPISHE